MRELRFMTGNKDVIAIDFGTLVKGGSTNYPRLYVSLDGTRKTFEGWNPRGRSLVQKGETWLPVELRELKFRTLNPKDGQPVGINILPCLLESENPLAVEENVCYDSWFGRPTSFLSCDGWSPLASVPIFQMIQGHWFKIYPEWEDKPYFECAADISAPEKGSTTSHIGVVRSVAKSQGE